MGSNREVDGRIGVMLSSRERELLVEIALNEQDSTGRNLPVLIMGAGLYW